MTTMPRAMPLPGGIAHPPDRKGTLTQDRMTQRVLPTDYCKNRNSFSETYSFINKKDYVILQTEQTYALN